MVRFDAPTAPVEVAPGVRLRAPTLRGEVVAHGPAPAGTRAPEVEAPTGALVAAMAAEDVREVMLLELQARATRGPGGVRGGPGEGEEDTVVLEVPDLGDTVGQVVMAVHEGGAITWHPPDQAAAAGPTRGAGGTTFRIRVPEAAPPPVDAEAGEEPAQRGLMGLAGRTLLKVLVFPLARDLAGRAALSLASRWEAGKRPHRLRWYGPGPDRDGGADVDAEGLARLREGRGLLLVHGTFSTATAGFGQLPDELVGRLHHAYEGRVVALEHPSLSVSPVDNVAWLRDRLGDGQALDVDVLTHSRGGLVGRVLAGQAGVVPQLRVGSLVFGATPNHGTPLADPGHVTEFLDRTTSLLNLFPPGPAEVVQSVLEALLTAVKAVVAGGLTHLPGLSAMDPSGEWLAELARADRGEVVLRAIAADYEPSAALAVAFKHRVKDAVVDRVMGDAPNDMVVPTVGVSGTMDDPDAFVEDPLVFSRADGVHHSSIFEQPRTHARLETWLAGA